MLSLDLCRHRFKDLRAYGEGVLREREMSSLASAGQAFLLKIIKIDNAIFKAVDTWEMRTQTLLT